MASNGFKLDEKNRVSHGMTVPKGYFEAFNATMSSKLPYNPAAENPESLAVQRRTLWQRCRPYVYMAAMFAGVWCMTQMFSLMKTGNGMDIEGNQIITAALSNNDFYDDYIVQSVDEYDLLDGLYTQGVDISQYQF